jgi:hypothetical protein
MKPSAFRPKPRSSPQATKPAPAPMPSPSFPKMGNPFRKISRRPSGPAGFKEGGATKESKAMVKKEVSFMKKKGAPKSMLKHEMKEAGMEAGGVTKKMPTAKQMGSLGLKHGGMKKMAGGGLAGGHKSADGIAKKGKTATKMVKMAKGGRYC